MTELAPPPVAIEVGRFALTSTHARGWQVRLSNGWLESTAPRGPQSPHLVATLFAYADAIRMVLEE